MDPRRKVRAHEFNVRSGESHMESIKRYVVPAVVAVAVIVLVKRFAPAVAAKVGL